MYNLYNAQSLSYYKLYVTLAVIQIVTPFFTAFVKTIKLQNIKNEIVWYFIYFYFSVVTRGRRLEWKVSKIVWCDLG